VGQALARRTRRRAARPKDSEIAGHFQRSSYRDGYTNYEQFGGHAVSPCRTISAPPNGTAHVRGQRPLFRPRPAMQVLEAIARVLWGVVRFVDLALQFGIGRLRIRQMALSGVGHLHTFVHTPTRLAGGSRPVTNPACRPIESPGARRIRGVVTALLSNSCSCDGLAGSPLGPENSKVILGPGDLAALCFRASYIDVEGGLALQLLSLGDHFLSSRDPEGRRPGPLRGLSP
jgi:hypothetical protein